MAKSAKKVSAKKKTLTAKAKPVPAKPKAAPVKAKTQAAAAKGKVVEKKVEAKVKEPINVPVYSASSQLVKDRLLTAEGWKRMVIKTAKKDKKV